MKAQTQAVVIGGGVVGCSVLYHLTKAGWRDAVPVERDQLTSGSTWHAAAGFHTSNGDPLLDAREAKKLMPLLEEKYFVGTMLDAADGTLDPSGTTHAYAKFARIDGAERYQQTRLAGLTPRTDGTWDVNRDAPQATRPLH